MKVIAAKIAIIAVHHTQIEASRVIPLRDLDVGKHWRAQPHRSTALAEMRN